VTDFPWLTTLAAVPLVGAAAVAALPKGRDLLAKQVAVAVSLVPLAMTIWLALDFDPNSKAMFQFAETHEWIPQFGVSYALGVDGIALVLIAMATVLTPICILASWHDVEDSDVGDTRRSVKNYFALLLLLEAFMVGVFAATDVFLFYVLFEAMLVPMYFIIGAYGGAQRSYAAVKFLLYSLVGGLLMLAAVIGLYVSSSGGNQAFLFENLLGTHLGTGTERLLFLGFFVAFAIKAPLWPLHTWLPDAAAEAPPGGAVLLVGVLDKVGTFGMLRFCLPLFPNAAKWATPVIITLAVIGIIYGALLAIGQTDLKRLIAYTSISHFGFIVLGIFAMTTQGQSGSTLYMVNHGFSTAALFLIAGFMISRRGSRLITDFGGVQRVAPMLAGTFLVAGLSSLALPGLSSFVSEFLVLVGTFSRYQAAAVIGTGGIILASLYILLMYQRTMTGEPNVHTAQLADLNVREVWVVAPLLAVIIALGVYPNAVLDVINPAVARTMHQVGVTDPAPITPAANTVSEGAGK
jgi:NADH-quinone oxidoreductase subunit M